MQKNARFVAKRAFCGFARGGVRAAADMYLFEGTFHNCGPGVPGMCMTFSVCPAASGGIAAGLFCAAAT